MKKFFEEFKTFIMKGNILDMAVGVIVGGAFGAITSSLVGDIVTPLLAVLCRACSERGHKGRRRVGRNRYRCGNCAEKGRLCVDGT